jgi:hypothetical protein
MTWGLWLYFPSEGICAADLTWTDPGANLGLRCDRPVTNSLSHSTVSGEGESSMMTQSPNQTPGPHGGH